jgi:hypothetical protein
METCSIKEKLLKSRKLWFATHDRRYNNTECAFKHESYSRDKKPNFEALKLKKKRNTQEKADCENNEGSKKVKVSQIQVKILSSVTG